MKDLGLCLRLRCNSQFITQTSNDSLKGLFQGKKSPRVSFWFQIHFHPREKFWCESTFLSPTRGERDVFRSPGLQACAIPPQVSNICQQVSNIYQSFLMRWGAWIPRSPNHQDHITEKQYIYTLELTAGIFIGRGSLGCSRNLCLKCRKGMWVFFPLGFSLDYFTRLTSQKGDLCSEAVCE